MRTFLAAAVFGIWMASIPLVMGQTSASFTIKNLPPHIATNSALRLTPGAVGARTIRDGFYAAGDHGDAVYDYSAKRCSLNSGNGDNGSQVKAAISGCWIADFSVVPANVRQFGAKGDCAYDDGPAFAAALSLGIPIYAPSGHYLISTGGVYSTAPVRLTGDGYEEDGLAYGKHCDLTKTGTYIVHTKPTITPFTLSGAAIRGSTFDNFAVVQLHSAPGASWAPTVYQPVFYLTATNGGVDLTRLGFGGVYAAVLCDHNTARVRLSNIKGQIFTYLFTNDVSLDISKLEDIHLWVYWSSDANVMAWQIANTDLVWLGRQDGLQVDRFFALGQRSCFRFSQGTWGAFSGAATAVQISSMFCDVTKYSIWADSSVIAPSFAITQLWHGGFQLNGSPVPNGNVLQIDGQNVIGRIENMNVIGVAESVINNTNTTSGAQVNFGTIAAASFGTGWNITGTGPYTGTFPVIRDASPSGAASIYSILHPVFPQNAGTTAGGGISSGVINTNANAQLFMVNQDQAWYSQAVTAGGVYAWPTWADTLFLTGAVASATVRLPISPLDGTKLTLTCDSAITALTVTTAVGSGFALVNPPTSCTAGQTFSFKTTLAGTPTIHTSK